MQPVSSHQNWFSQQLAKMTPLSWSILVVLLSFGIYKTVQERQLYDNLDEHHLTTCGVIKRYERSGHSGTSTYYEYLVGGVRYTAIAKDKRFAACIQTNSCIGLTFEVEYAEGNPSNSRMVWSKPNCTVDPSTPTRNPE